MISGNANNLGLVMRARKEADEMYASSYTSCMNKAGYLLR
jgi:hypothetical protein